MVGLSVFKADRTDLADDMTQEEKTQFGVGILASSAWHTFQSVFAGVILVWFADRESYGPMMGFIRPMFHGAVAVVPVLHAASSTYYMRSVYNISAAEAQPKLVTLALLPVCGAIFVRLPWCQVWPSRAAIMCLVVFSWVDTFNNNASIDLLIAVLGVWLFLMYCAFDIEDAQRQAFHSKHAENAAEIALEKEKLRMEAEAKSKAERVLVSYLCHEIRNPFNGVLGFTELMISALAKIVPQGTIARGIRGGARTHDAQDAEQEVVVEGTLRILAQVADWCNIVVINSEHIRDVLDNVLDLSKLESGTLELAYSRMTVVELCKNVHLLLRSTVRTGVEFVFEVVPETLVINSDLQRWKQLLVNLVSNALKFTHSGRVVLRIQQVREGVSVDVCDTGVGIGVKEQTMLFQKYQQLHATVPDTKGTGLGLVIAQRIAALLESDIQIESPWRMRSKTDGEGEGGDWEDGNDQGGAGTRFYFQVENCVAAADTIYSSDGTGGGGVALSADQSARLKVLGGGGLEGGVDERGNACGELRKGLKVLVVDDDMMNRMIMSTKLTQSDEFKHTAIAINQATSEADVGALVEEHGVGHFDVIIMDEVLISAHYVLAAHRTLAPHLSTTSRTITLLSSILGRIRHKGVPSQSSCAIKAVQRLSSRAAGTAWLMMSSSTKQPALILFGQSHTRVRCRCETTCFSAAR
jgi:signal transduction histidine kinase